MTERSLTGSQLAPTLRALGVWAAVLFVSVFASRLVRANDVDLVITEILYDADPTNSGGEYIELQNRGSETLAIGGWALAEAVEFVFPEGTEVAPGEFIVLARNAVEAAEFYGVEIFGEYDGRLDNRGDTILLKTGACDGCPIVEFVVYDDEEPWPNEADGAGPSIELIEGALDNTDPASWTVGDPFSPGRENSPGETNQGDVAIHEILYHPIRVEGRRKFDRINAGPYEQDGDDELGEYLELINRSESVVDLSGWSFTDGIDYVFPEGTSLAPGELLVVGQNPDTLLLRFGVHALGPYEGRLRDEGERVTLRDADLRLVDSLHYNDRHPWPLSPDSIGIALECIDPEAPNDSASNWRPSQADFPRPSSVVPSFVDGWQRITVTDTATSNRLFIHVDGPGEWLLDDVSAQDLTTGDFLEFNGDFEEGDVGWLKSGNHSETFWTQADARSGTACEHIVATGAGSGSSNSLQLRRVLGMVAGQSYSLSLWVKHLSGHPELTFRLSGGGFETTVHAPEVVTVADEWSDASNPTGAWSYRDGGGNLISGRSSSWLPTILASDQSAWTNAGDSGVPGWCRSVGEVAGLDFPVGSVGGYGPAELRWTAPSEGVVTISGGVWLVRDSATDQRWEIHAGDTLISSGVVQAGDATASSSSPAAFEDGSDGAAALSRVVEAGDTIHFSAEPEGNFTQTLVGFDVGVSFIAGIPVDPAPLAPPVGGFIGNGSPGERNSVSSDNLPPYVRWLRHDPELPKASDSVTITALVTDETLESVELEVSLGTSTSTSTLAMRDDGQSGDGEAGDGVFGVTLPGRPSQTLVHYRLIAEDGSGATTEFPYPDDPSPTQAYYHYDGDIDTRLTLFHLFLRSSERAKLDANPRSSEYVDASLVVNGVAYPHIGVRYRGRASRDHPKRPWKFRFNKGDLYDGNKTLDTMLTIPFTQKIIFDVFDLAGITNLQSDLVRLHIGDSFWGVYVAFESPTGSWLDKHDHDGDGEVYKARTVETPANSKNTDLYSNQLITDLDFWGAWNKKISPLERPTRIRELTEALNGLSDEELLPWLDEKVDLEQWFTRWSLYILMNVDDFAGHNYYLFIQGEEGGKWQQLAYDFDSGFTYSRVGPIRALYGDGKQGDNPGWQRNKFCERVSNNATLRRIYFLRMRKILDELYKTEIVFPMVDELFALSAPDRALDIARWGTMRSSTNELKSVMNGQRTRMRNFLATQSLPGDDDIPTIEPAGGPFGEPVTVTIGVPAGLRAVYTTDGSDPRLSTTRVVYGGDPILVEVTTTLRVAGIDDALDFEAGDWTELATETYTIEIVDIGLGPFLRGDCNESGAVDLSDAVSLLDFLFLGGAEPPCLAACDVNVDGQVTGVTDAVALLGGLFLGGPPPGAPYPDCGTSDAAGDETLGCATRNAHCEAR